MPLSRVCAIQSRTLKQQNMEVELVANAERQGKEGRLSLLVTDLRRIPNRLAATSSVQERVASNCRSLSAHVDETERAASISTPQPGHVSRGVIISSSSACKAANGTYESMKS